METICPKCGKAHELKAVCPDCKTEYPVNLGKVLGHRTSKRKTAAARRNAKLGGWPKGKPRKHSRSIE